MPRIRDAALVGEARAAVASGESPASIAARLGVQARTVQRWMREAGEQRQAGRPAGGEGSGERIAAMKAAGLSWGQIAAAEGIARSTARDRYNATAGRLRDEEGQSPPK